MVHHWRDFVRERSTATVVIDRSKLCPPKSNVSRHFHLCFRPEWKFHPTYLHAVERSAAPRPSGLTKRNSTMPMPIVIRDPHLDKPREDALPAIRGFGSISNTSPPNHATTRNGDISTSPRFLGYIFSFFSSAVTLASSVEFYLRGVYPTDSSELREVAVNNGINFTTKDMTQLSAIYDGMNFSSKLSFTSRGIVTHNYQVYGAIAVSALLTVITVLVLFAHLDSFCCPNYFRVFFRDGSKSERNLILALIAISTVSLQICTSRFSIGEAQVNVFFSTWTNFISCTLNFEVWRNSAGRHSTFQNVLFDKEFPLKRHWFLLSIFTMIVSYCNDVRFI